jgi:hypothetical protein
MPAEDNESPLADFDVNAVIAERMAGMQDEKLKAARTIIELIRLCQVKCLVVVYSGEGDSGQIDDIVALQEVCSPEDYNCTSVAVDDDGTRRLERAQFTDELKETYGDTLSFDELSSYITVIEYLAAYVTPSGYENNAGGQGVMVFDASSGECRCNHGINYTDTDYHEEVIQAIPEENCNGTPVPPRSE